MRVFSLSYCRIDFAESSLERVMGETNTTHRWWKPSPSEVFTHLVAIAITGVLAYPFSYLKGQKIGFEAGREEALKASQGVAEKAASDAVAKITPEVVRSQAELVCASEISKLNQAHELQLQQERQASEERAAQAARTADTLAAYYEIFKRHVRNGASAATKEGNEKHLLELAQQIVVVQRTAREAMYEVSFKVLNSQVDELAKASAGNDAKRVAQLLREINGTLELRDVAFRTAVSKLRVGIK
jgi:hypothetical protein